MNKKTLQTLSTEADDVWIVNTLMDILESNGNFTLPY
ncbi:hypothetical protein A3Q56_04567 [Intoshia linei]|uniref:Uncharacterized protein n=1 Tax=Intoshia linei TaxID=1819745 RepID=A0A177B074_9BILA|nr:hypothetical protein A3Q56_04567 [Intoshia linei]